MARPCANLFHYFDPADQTDTHVTADQEQDHLFCDQQPCPHRYNGVTHDDWIYDDNLLAPLPAIPSVPDTPLMASPHMDVSELGTTVGPGGRPPADTQQQPPPAPGTPAPPAPPLTDRELIEALVRSTLAMQGAIGRLQESHNSSQSLVQKPSAFKGTDAAQARAFLAAYTVYAQNSPRTHSIRQHNPVTGRTDHFQDTQKWITSALSLMQDEAAIWATPHLEAIGQNQITFPTWESFTQAFRERFEPADEAVDAKEKIKALRQGKSTVPEYAARFKELMSRTGYSENDLRDRFYDHLAGNIKDLLVGSERPHKRLNDLILVATDIDVRLRERQAEKAREQGRPVPTITRPATSAPFANKDPNAMEIDATKGPNGKSRFDFLRAMTGKCFGCGSPDHAKKDGQHDREICKWCSRAGHREGVCQDKFLGKPRKQRVAATTDINAVAGPSTTAPTATIVEVPKDDLAQRMAGLLAEMEELKKHF